VESGRGRPLTNTPPSWFTPLWPVHSHIVRTYFWYSLEFKYSIRVYYRLWNSVMVSLVFR